MSNYAVMNILDFMDALGEDSLKAVLSKFSCPNHVRRIWKYRSLCRKTQSNLQRKYNLKNSRTIAYHLANRTVSIIPSLDKKE